MDSPNRSFSSPGVTPKRQPPQPQLSSPIVVPPTPDPPKPNPSPYGSMSYTAEGDDAELMNKRRSMFRSPGTASSPDLATLVRRAKDKEGGGGVSVASQRDRDDESSQMNDGLLAPSGSGQRLRGSSSTSSFSVITPQMAAPITSPTDGDRSWMLSPKTHEVDGAASPEPSSSKGERQGTRSRSGSKSGKSMRLKTSNFFGKILTGTVRDKSKVDPSNVPIPATPVSSGPHLYSRFGTSPAAPPVPPLPDHYRTPPPPQTSVDPSSTSSPSSSLNYSKPLPPIVTAFASPRRLSDQVEKQRVVPASPPDTPDRTIKSRPADMHKAGKPSLSSIRGRSASVSDVDWTKEPSPVAEAKSPVKREAKKEDMVRPAENKRSDEWDSSDLMLELTGQLSSQLDQISTSSPELTDPSTPARKERMRTTTLDSPLNHPVSGLGAGTIRPRTATGSPTLGTNDGRRGSEPTLTPGQKSPTSPKRASLSTAPSAFQDSNPRKRVNSRPGLSANSPGSNFRSNSAPITPQTGSRTQGTPSSPSTTPAFQNPFNQSQRPSVTITGAVSPRGSHGAASSSDPSFFEERSDAGMKRFASDSHTAISEQRKTVRLIAASPYGHNQGSTSSSLLDVNRKRHRSLSPHRTPESEEELEAKGKEYAQRCWTEDETFLAKEKIAEWLGGTGKINAIALQRYVNYYDFTGLRLDHAFRRFCGKLYLKAESQQIDRILEEFSRRYWENNTNCLFGSASVVHAVAYSLLLLNTDLHIADLNTHMSRAQFVRNTIHTIQSQLQPEASTVDLFADEDRRSESSEPTGLSTIRAKSKRSNSVHSWNSGSKEGTGFSTSSGQLISSPTGVGSLNTSTASVQTPTSGQVSSAHEPRVRAHGTHNNGSTPSIFNGRNWDSEMENLLKDMYSAVKSQEIRQPSAYSLDPSASLSPTASYNTLSRHRSQAGDRVKTLKRGSIRGITTLLGQQPGVSPYSSNSSIDGRDGRISPSPSFATSVDGLSAANSFLSPALGFASNLSRTIIRETQEEERSVHSDDSADTTVSITDEELALLGAPWAKEGMLCRKQYWESAGKRAKNKTWQDVFVVIQKGELDMFIFGDGGGGDNYNVGGGNWLANAQSVGNVQLAHSLSHVLPPPGYNRQRPHCFVLTLASGGVYFFQTGTEDLLNEWVSTCNYWAARLSKEPLSGGVSNMEYGWNRVADPMTGSIIEDDATSVADPTDTLSIRSGRSRLSKKSWPDPGTIGRNAGDHRLIHEWKPPMPSTVPSTHDEEGQLEALQKQITSLKNDLQVHNDLRKPMGALYPPRSSAASKALSNWEKKSQYLLTEIVKYETYVESLKSAMALRLKKRGEKALERALQVSNSEDAYGKHARRFAGLSEDDTIMEADEPNTPGPRSSKSHTRQGAQVGDSDTE